MALAATASPLPGATVQPELSPVPITKDAYLLEGTDLDGKPFMGALTVRKGSLTVTTESFARYVTMMVGLTVPLIIGALLIRWWLVAQLTGVREYYADHVALQHTSRWQLLAGLKHVKETTTRASLGKLRLLSSLTPFSRIAFLPTHPSEAQRWHAANTPALVFTSPRAIGVMVFGVIAVLGLLKLSLFGSLLTRMPDTLMPVTLAFVLLATFLIPHLVLSQTPTAFRKAVQQAAAWYWALLLVVQICFSLWLVAIVLLFPQSIQDSFDQVNNLLPNTQMDERFLDPLYFLYSYSISPFVFTLLATPVLIVLALVADTWMKQLILRCYAAPWSVRRRNWYLRISTIVVALLLEWIVVPLVSIPFFPGYADDREIMMSFLATIALVAAIIWGLLLRHWRGTYGKRCPGCGQACQPGTYHFGVTCPQTNQSLTPWLFLSGTGDIPARSGEQD